MQLIPCEQPARWSDGTRGFLDDNYRQRWAFGIACADRIHAVSEHVLMMDGDGVFAAADVRIKRMPIVSGGVAYVNGGPLVRRGRDDDAAHLGSAVRLLQAEYVERRGLVLRIAPPIGSPEWNAGVDELFRSLRFSPVERATSYRTLMLDLRRPLPEIRKSLDQKWRNGLNRAERNGLDIRCGADDALFSQFLELYSDLRERKGFDVDLDADFHADVQRRFDSNEKFQISLADFEGRPVAGHVGSVLGDTSVYLLGGGNRTGLDQKASYLLQWQAVSAAHSRGCAWYDLGGIDPVGNPGVYHFKSGLNGIEMTAPGPFEFAPTGLISNVVRKAERVYRWMRRHAKRTERPRKAALES